MARGNLGRAAFHSPGLCRKKQSSFAWGGGRFATPRAFTQRPRGARRCPVPAAASGTQDRLPPAQPARVIGPLIKKTRIYFTRSSRGEAEGSPGQPPPPPARGRPLELEGAEVRGAAAGLGLWLVTDALVDELLAALVLRAQRQRRGRRRRRRLLAGRRLRLLPLLLAALRGEGGAASGRDRGPGPVPARPRSHLQVLPDALELLDVVQLQLQARRFPPQHGRSRPAAAATATTAPPGLLRASRPAPPGSLREAPPPPPWPPRGHRRREAERGPRHGPRHRQRWGPRLSGAPRVSRPCPQPRNRGAATARPAPGAPGQGERRG